ncbi:developmental regulator VelB [Colletotrichum salicis]|uniref:Developmental regulator VelB n=1 Tax=Colletotrichum salicis TaxID=1209931 RepID=A0A135UTU1_9PEZI|nr:developmental regulator VelB [Colletotrichum salicis]
MNYGHQHPSGGYHPMPPGHPVNQMPQLPPMGYPAPAPLPSNMPPNMPPNGMPMQHQHHQPPPPPPAQAPVPASISKTDDLGRKYELVVVQQPQRARMCGFGDKDRRPITPPPCIKVVVRDAKTGQEINPNDIDSAHYIIQVDLWSEDGTQEVNLVRHSSNTASISTTQPYSYTALREDPMNPPPTQPYQDMQPYGSAPMGYGQQPPPPQPQQHMMPGYGMAAGSNYPQYQSTNSRFAPATQYYPQHANPGPVPSQADMAYGHRQSLSMAASQPQGMFTRNIIGSVSSSAFRLNDVDDQVGVWFIMQDLSVRTEGHFRLRFSFVNIAKPPGVTNPNGSMVNQHKAPILAATFSDAFQVYSAKKFPGVCESTPLSKCFATQGIKIPIRKEGAADGKKGGDDDDEAYQ